jgi:predicted Zn-dependent protease
MLTMKRNSLVFPGMLVFFLCGMVSVSAADTAAVRPCSDAKNKMDDVYCIGQRNVAHHSIISEQKEVAIGQKYAEQIDHSAKLVKDPVITEYVNRVAQNVARSSDAKIPITVKVIDSPEINAFTLPGGFIYVNTGLLHAAGSEAQLAGVLAHETAHVACRHWASDATKQTLLQYAMIPLIFTPMSYPVYIGISEGLNLGVPLAFLKFSRSDEQQADFLGLQYMWKAGYDPDAYLSMFAKIIQEGRRTPGSVAGVFMDHPPTQDRIINAEKEIKTILPSRPEYLVSDSEFQGIQERLTDLLGRMKKVESASNKPTLVKHEPKSGQPASTNGGQTTADDKPPVLQRRN